MAKIRVRVPLRRSKYGKRHSFSYTRKRRPKGFKKVKVYPKVYRFKAVRDEWGQYRGLKFKKS